MTLTDRTREPCGCGSGEEYRWCHGHVGFHRIFDRFVELARSPEVRSMLEFACEEIVIPDGPFKGMKFDPEKQPYTKLWFDAVDSGKWRRFVVTAPSQSGKTLCAFVIPILYHLFEMGETVICGIPDMSMAGDKWFQDLLPVIKSTRYAKHLPAKGGGSKGGKVTAIRFTNGATLRFMSGGGGDKSRAGYTARVLVITETDGMDTPGEASREADKISQLEARTNSYGDDALVFMECTVTVEEGRTWSEYDTNSTRSEIMGPCPYCKEYVCPERDHLLGWQEVDSIIEARERAKFHCPDCGHALSERDRERMNNKAKLLHKGQELSDKGKISGDPPLTDTLGFRWSGFHNLFTSPANLGGEEWRGSRAEDEDTADKRLRQFYWAIPYVPPRLDTTPLTTAEIIKRTSKLVKGKVPEDCDFLTCGIDLGDHMMHYCVVSWRKDFTGHVVDYGIIGIPSDHMAVEKAILLTLREFRETVLSGWAWSERNRVPDQVWIDAGHKGDVVKAFCREKESFRRFMPVYGRSSAHRDMKAYMHPEKASKGGVARVGERYYVKSSGGAWVIFVDANHWKTRVHQALRTPADSPGALTLFWTNDSRKLHREFAKQVTAEKKVEVFEPGKGTTIAWEKVRQNNHYLDVSYYSMAAAHLCGASLIEPETRPKEEPTAESSTGITMPDGRPFVITERTR
ncbi:MAG: terminase gpA endonuclease subunit [Phycisphaerae bacterium]